MSSTTGTKIEYPTWLRDFFVLMTATYGALWSNQFLDDNITEALKRIWYFQLKNYAEFDIRQAMLECGRTFDMPPKPSQFIEIVQKLKRIREDRELFRKQEEQALLPKPARKPLSREALEAKVKMFESIGMHAKAEVYANEIRHMDM